MLVQKYEYEGVVIEAKYAIKYVMIEMYCDCIKVHESITYLDEVKTSAHQILIRLIEIVIGKTFDLKELEVVKTEYINDYGG